MLHRSIENRSCVVSGFRHHDSKGPGTQRHGGATRTCESPQLIHRVTPGTYSYKRPKLDENPAKVEVLGRTVHNLSTDRRDRLEGPLQRALEVKLPEAEAMTPEQRGGVESL
ncbi:Hypothetical protein A7982_08476 [Minicystis rosea]|nr:Hypothetical protein A7982_08476 [Minicystis rosea]